MNKLEWLQWHCSGAFIVNFEQVNADWEGVIGSAVCGRHAHDLANDLEMTCVRQVSLRLEIAN